jgi:PKD repeat protein
LLIGDQKLGSIDSLKVFMKKIYLIFCLLVVGFAKGFSSPVQSQIEILVQDSATFMPAVTTILFTSNTSPSYFSSEDVMLTPDTSSNPVQLYSFTQDNVSCSFNSYGTFNNTTVLRLGLGIAESGTYTFSLQQFANFDPASMLFLEDRQLGVWTNLRQGSYTVPVSQAGQNTNRFFLHVTYPPVVGSGAAGCTNNNGTITITEDNSVLWSSCKVYDSASVLVAIDTDITGNFSFTGLPGGNYRVEFDYGLFAPIQYIEVQEHQLISAMTVASNHGTVGENMLFYSTSSNADQFQWDFGDGSNITGVSNPTYAYYLPGTYTVTVNCSNAYGCSSHSDTVVYIDVASSIDKIDGNTVQIITDGKTVKIELDNATAGNYTYDVYNIEGQVIKTGNITSGDMVLGFSNEASGMYIVSIRSASSILSKKVIITQ